MPFSYNGEHLFFLHFLLTFLVIKVNNVLTKTKEGITMSENNSTNKTLGTIALVFMIISCVGVGISAIVSLFAPSVMAEMLAGYGEEITITAATGIVYAICSLIPLAWILPMTISVSKKLKNNQPIGVGFKVCTLLFVSMISGILLLCRTENDNNQLQQNDNDQPQQ